jgi:hypothetical protein
MNASPYLILYDHLEKLTQSIPGYLAGLPMSADKERTKLNTFLQLMTVQRNEYIECVGVEGTDIKGASSGEMGLEGSSSAGRGLEGTSSGETGLEGTSSGETGLEGASSGEKDLSGDLKRLPIVSWDLIKALHALQPKPFDSFGMYLHFDV